MCLAKGHNTVPPVEIEHSTPRSGEAVLTSTHNVCFERKYQNLSTEIFTIFTAEKLSVYCMGKFS